MLKKALVLGISLILAVNLTACGGADIANSSSNVENQNMSTSVIRKAGGHIYFGNYNGEEIVWHQVAKDGNKVLIVGKRIEVMPYSNKNHATWETSDIRKWLNGDFLNNSFTNSQKKIIKTTNIKAEDNEQYGTKGGKDTNDKIFILSQGEYNKYIKGKNWEYNNILLFGQEKFWLRTPGRNDGYVMCVYTTSGFNKESYFEEESINWDKMGVCPACWVEYNQ